MRRARWGIATRVSVAVASVIVASGFIAPVAAAGAAPDAAPLLFVLRGRASVSENGLRVVTPAVEWFTDRPERRAGTMSAKQLARRWDGWGFATDPPNAAITGTDVDAVVELSEPRVRGTRMLFKTMTVRGKLPRGRLGRISMFVDAADSVGSDCAALQASKNVAVAGPQLELANCDLSGADLSGVILGDADLEGANLSGADLTGVYLANADLEGANVSGADLTGSQLEGAYADSADLTGANLSRATMYGTNLGNVSASDANFSDALMGGATLAGANLTGANLTGANLQEADFRGTDLTGADLTGAVSFPQLAEESAIFDDTTCPEGTNSDDNGGHC